MKRFFFFLAATLMAASCCSDRPEPSNPDYFHTAKDVKYVFTEAADLTMYGKIFFSIPNPYHRVDTVVYKGFTKGENLQVRESSGLACCFKTNSSTISVKTQYGTPTYPSNTNGFSGRGYDLYIKDAEGEWLWAASGVQGDSKLDRNLVLIKDMEPVEHECILYFPLYSEVNSVKIGVEEGASLEGIMPFRHRVVIFGSSYTHGSSTSRAGMTYPAQFSRNTGIQLLSLGCSGNCKLQDYFCEALCHAEDVDAFIFDSFSNPSIEQINERLFPFIEKLQAAHPGKPLIFQRTIRRENGNFSGGKKYAETRRIEVADSLMAIACKKYKDVYYIHPNATAKDHNATVDGVHPSNYGYTLWAGSIEKPVCRILKKYGIK